MARWLFKEEPSCFSFEKLTKQGKATWDGIANALALKHLRQVKAGDEVFFYETGNVKSVVGIMKVTTDAKQGVEAKDVSVQVKPVSRLARAVPLAEIKADKDLREWEWARISRLSIMPVTEKQWRRVLALSQTD